MSSDGETGERSLRDCIRGVSYRRLEGRSLFAHIPPTLDSVPTDSSVLDLQIEEGIPTTVSGRNSSRPMNILRLKVRVSSG